MKSKSLPGTVGRKQISNNNDNLYENDFLNLLVTITIVMLVTTSSGSFIFWLSSSSLSSLWFPSVPSLFFPMVWSSPFGNTQSDRILTQDEDDTNVPPNTATDKKNGPKRVLYIMTTLAEYNSGTRQTVRGSDRLQETLIPVLSEGVHNMVHEFGYAVDVFIISAFTMLPERLQLIRESLPKDVGLQVWDDAFPLGYDTGHFNNQTSKVGTMSIGLARQHRFVIKDKFQYYDFFVCFEDDMLIKGYHVEHFYSMTQEIYRLRALAPDQLPAPNNHRRALENSFHGNMTKDQLTRTIPGFIRVEVLLEEEKYGAQKTLAPIPVDLNFTSPATTIQHVDPLPCCHFTCNQTNKKDFQSTISRPKSPSHDKLMIWEIDIFPLGVRRMPEHSSLDWVVLQRGPRPGKIPDTAIYGDYWSGTDGYFSNTKNNRRRAGPDARNYMNNQGGWMATRQQIFEWHTVSYDDEDRGLLCLGGFLPPFYAPHYRFDGLDLRDVEWWSGGLHLATARHACNMQRIISIKAPSDFSKHLIYHTANNKQVQLQGQSQRFNKASVLLGQLNTVRKNAEKAIYEKRN